MPAYNIAKHASMLGEIDIVSDTFMVLLVGPAFAFNAAHNYVSAISSAEVSGTGYVRKTISSKLWTRSDYLSLSALTADNPSWAGIDVGLVAGAVLYRTGSSDADAMLMGAYAVSPAYMTGTGIFTIKWSSNGVLIVS